MGPEAPYRFEVAPVVDRELEQLPRPVAEASVEFIASVLVYNPYRVSKPLTREPLLGLRSAVRARDYRIVFWVDDEAGVVKVVRVGHRSRVYRDRPAGA